MRNPEISVVVPVYNTASYLRKCLDSLRAQTMNDIEFILIDDGSTDGSSSILQEYVAQDSRFRLISRSNSGASAARNCGLRNARGEFVGFVDSDDWIEADMYSSLHRGYIANPEADIIQCAYIQEYVSESKSLPCRNDTIIKFLSRSGGYLKGAEAIMLDSGSVCNRIYRRTMLEKNNIIFKENAIFGEDVLFQNMSLIVARKIVVLPEFLYHYRKNRSGSLTYSDSRSRFTCVEAMARLDQAVQKKGCTELIPWVNHLKLSFILWVFESLNSDLQQELFGRIRQYFAEAGMQVNCPMKYPPFTGCFLYDIRYLILRVLHPLTLRVVAENNFLSFRRIIKLRKFLSELPGKLSR